MSTGKDFEIIDLRVGVNGRKWFVAEFRMKNTNDQYNELFGNERLYGSISCHFQISFLCRHDPNRKHIIGLFPLANVYDIQVNDERAGKAMHKWF